MKKIGLLMVLLMGLSTTFAQLKMPSIFTDGMVLQQKSNVKVWGKSAPGAKIAVKASWLSKKMAVKATEQGDWEVMLQTPAADFQPYELKVESGKNKLAFSDIVFGEVWLCSGQSNMEMKMKGWYGQPVIGGPQAILNSKNDNLRYVEVKKIFSCNEEEDCQTVAGWVKAAPATVSTCSATAYFFGRQLQQTLGVPVGLIVAPWGSADITAYMCKDILRDFPQYTIPVKKEQVKNAPTTPTVLYNAMIHPIIGYGIKGAIWYQGETNRFKPEEYVSLFKAMVTDWRAKWNVGDFPFYYAQIAPFTYRNGINSAFIREAQMNCEKAVKNTGMIVTTDVGEEFNIHPAEKETIGRRFAVIALDRTYKVGGLYSRGPVCKDIKMKDGKVTISFYHVGGGLTTCNQPLDQFEVAGEDQVFYPAKAKIDHNNVVVTCDKVKHPVAVRYAFKHYSKGTLYNIEGCPAAPFRSDNWAPKPPVK